MIACGLGRLGRRTTGQAATRWVHTRSAQTPWPAGTSVCVACLRTAQTGRAGCYRHWHLQYTRTRCPCTAVYTSVQRVCCLLADDWPAGVWAWALASALFLRPSITMAPVGRGIHIPSHKTSSRSHLPLASSLAIVTRSHALLQLCVTISITPSWVLTWSSSQYPDHASAITVLRYFPAPLLTLARH